MRGNVQDHSNIARVFAARYPLQAFYLPAREVWTILTKDLCDNPSMKPMGDLYQCGSCGH
jgi:hypothetical protein